jgi:hypothetical protein
MCAQQHYGYRERCDVLLIWKILVDRDERIELCCSQREQRSVLNTAPAPISTAVLTVCAGKALRRRRGTDSSSSRRICEQTDLGSFEHRDYGFPRDGREILQELL